MKSISTSIKHARSIVDAMSRLLQPELLAEKALRKFEANFVRRKSRKVIVKPMDFEKKQISREIKTADFSFQLYFPNLFSAFISLFPRASGFYFQRTTE
jgi:hypothetical protein